MQDRRHGRTDLMVKANVRFAVYKKGSKSLIIGYLIEPGLMRRAAAYGSHQRDRKTGEGRKESHRRGRLVGEGHIRLNVSCSPDDQKHEA